MNYPFDIPENPVNVLNDLIIIYNLYLIAISLSLLISTGTSDLFLLFDIKF